MRLRKEDLEGLIEGVEYAVHISTGGKIFRWAILKIKDSDGFCVHGEASAALDPQNDDEDLGNQVAYSNAFDKLWQLEAYHQAKIGNSLKA